MVQEISLISLAMPLGMGRVNCYLIRNDAGHFLIDTGSSNARGEVGRELQRRGVAPTSLRLIILTHGDFDHIGNAAHLRSAFGSRIAMHRDDSAMAERGDMFVNRKKPNILIRSLLPLLSGFGASERFTPDLLVDDGYNLSQDGLGAKVVHLPGHSRGSIGILTVGGELFCGDLFESTKAPALNPLMDDPAAAAASLGILGELSIRTVYPGHGRPFTMQELSGNTS
jgi:glyoxylase-like metal-dependent hydrolase (beta-lactamase superfamily II)